MVSKSPLDSIPMWCIFAGTFVLVLVSEEIGYRLGRYRHARSQREKEGPVGAMVTTVLGLLAFLLAFTFSLAATRYDARRQVILEEANAIGTTYLRADLLPEGRDEVRAMLREYVDIRVEAVRSGVIEPAMHQSEKLHTALWARAATAGQKNPGSIAVGLFIQSLNEVIDLHATRMQVNHRSRIPMAIWLALYLVAILALGAMGYHAGLTETVRSIAILAVVIAFSLVMWLIADLDRPQEGMLTVSQQAMIDLRNSMTDVSP